MPREIGWSQESNLLYQIKQLLSRASGGGGSSTPAVETYATYSAFPVTGTAGTFYVDASTGNQYVWDGSEYVSLGFRPTFPTVTQNGKAVYLFYPISGNMSAIPPTTYLSRLAYVPQLNKRYPDVSIPYNCYGDVLNSNFVVPSSGNNSHTVSGVTMIYTNSAAQWSSAAGFNTTTYTDLKHITASTWQFQPSGMDLQTYSFPELISVIGGYTIVAGTARIDVVAPKLEIITGTITITGTGLPKINFPSLLTCNSISATGTYPELTQINLPNLKFVQYGASINLAGTYSALTTINLSSLEYMNASTFNLPTSSTSLSTITLGPIKHFPYSFITTSNILTQASVDNILIRFAQCDGTGDSVPFINTITITGGAASPSAAGLAAKAILIARGCTVTTN